jgi:hypothetical protein
MTSRAAGRSYFRLQARMEVAKQKETARIGTVFKVMMPQGLKYTASNYEQRQQ